MEAAEILTEARRLGVSITIRGDRLRYQPASAVKPDLIEAMRTHKGELMRLLQERQDRQTWSDDWVLQEWRRVSIPQWRRILTESTRTQNKKDERYARWMLREVLKDPEYKEAAE